MQYLKYAALFMAFTICAFSCTKKKNDTPGKGGSANLKLYPQHHTVAKNLRNMKVYIKYGTQTPPSNGMYDDSVACTIVDSQSVGTLSGLKNGDYYLYSTGYDTSIFQNVKGGIPYTITQQADQNVLVPVSED